MSTKIQEIIDNVYYRKENIVSQNKESDDYSLSKNKGFFVEKCCLTLFVACLFLPFYFCLIANFLIIYILDYLYERNFFNLIVSFVDFIFHNYLFIILQNNVFISESNTIEMKEEKRISFIFPQNLKKKSDDNIILKNRRNKGKNFLVRNVNHLKSFFGITKCIILLNLFNTIFVNNRIHLIEYNITLKNKGTGTKYIFSSNSKFPMRVIQMKFI